MRGMILFFGPLAGARGYARERGGQLLLPIRKAASPAVGSDRLIVKLAMVGGLALMLTSGLAAQTLLTFKNGARVSGESVKIEGNYVVLTGGFGELRAPLEDLDHPSRGRLGLDSDDTTLVGVEDVTGLLAEPIQPAKLLAAGDAGLQSFEMATQLFDKRKVKVYYQLRSQGRFSKDLVALFMFPKENNFYKSSTWKRLVDLGFPVFGVEFIDMGPEQQADRKAIYYFPESGAHEVVLEAAALVRQRLQLPKRKLLVIGQSGGMSAAQQFAAAKSEEVEVLTGTGGRFYATPPRRSGIHWLLLATRWDHTVAPTEEIADTLAGQGDWTLNLTTLPQWFRRGREGSLYYHNPTALNVNFSLSFIEGMAALRGQDGVVPEQASWPIAYDPNWPGHIIRVTASTPVPARWKRLPSLDVYRWMLLTPLPHLEWTVRRAGAVDIRLILARPRVGLSPKGLILYQRSWADRQNLEEDMLQMAEDGYSVVAIDPNAKGTDWGRVGAWAEGDPALPVYLIAADDYDEQAVATAISSLGNRLKSVQLGWLEPWREDTAPLSAKAASDRHVPVRLIPASKENATTGLVAKNRWGLKAITCDPWKAAPSTEALRQIALRASLDYIDPPVIIPAPKKDKK
jgi:predicted alpha/beta hydrolase